MIGRTGFSFAAVVLSILCLVLVGCGEQPARTAGDEGGSGAGDETPGAVEGQGADRPPVEDRDVDEDREAAEAEEDEDLPFSGADFSFDLADPEVGQWISYGVDDQPVQATISIVGSDVVDGDECLWYQFEIPGEVLFKLLADFSDLEEATEAMGEMWSRFAGDPERFLRDALASSGADWATGMMTSEDALESGMAFLGGLKTVVVEDGGVLTAYDVSGVAEVIQPLVENPEMLGSMAGMSGFDMGAAGGGAPGMDTEEILAVLDDLDIEAGPVDRTVGGTSLDAIGWSVEYAPENVSFEVVFSNDLPILPLAYARVVDGDEEHWIEVRDFGFDGAVDKLPGEPVQTIDVAQMLEGFVQMAGSGAMRGMTPPR